MPTLNQCQFVGAIQTGEFATIRAVLEAWVGAPLKMKAKLSGEQLTHTDESLSVYCYRAFSLRPASEEFLIEGRASVGLEECRRKLEMLIQAFQGRGVDCGFDFNEIDEAGKLKGEQFTVP